MALREPVSTAFRPTQLRRQSSAARDERTQRFRLVFDFIETVLDHIADADNAAESPVPDDGKVADAAVGHFGHQLADAPRRIAGDNRPRHHLRDGQRQETGATMGEGMDNVALRDDPIDPLAVFAGDKSANISGDQRLYGCTYGLVGPDGRYCTSLVVQDCLDVHREASQALARAAPLANAYRIGAAAVVPQYMAIRPTLGTIFCSARRPRSRQGGDGHATKSLPWTRCGWIAIIPRRMVFPEASGRPGEGEDGAHRYL